MQALPEIERHAAEIRNRAFMVRHYRRPIQRAARAAAIRELGLTVRAAFTESEEFEPLLAALLDGLRPLPGVDSF